LSSRKIQASWKTLERRRVDRSSEIAGALNARPAPAGPEPGQQRPPEVGLLFGFIAIYFVVVVALAATGRYMIIAKTAVVPTLVVLALLMGRAASFVNDWAVFLASVVLFDCVRGLIYAVTIRFGLPIHAAYVARWDEALLGGVSLPVLLQQKLFHPPVIGPFEKFLTVIHGSHFVLFLFVGMATWTLRRDEFWRFRRAIILLMILGLSIYFIVPTVPPWMAAKLHIIGPIRHITAEIYNASVPSLQATLDVNPTAAMPSLHTAFPTLCSLIALHHFGRRAIALPIYTLLMLFAISYLGEHYVVDLAAGLLLAGFVYWVVYRSGFMREPGRPFVRAPGRLDARNAIAALLIVAASEGVGQLSLHTRHNLFVGPKFIQDEMVGRSDKVHLALARHALVRGDIPGARRELVLAQSELRDPKDRAEAAWLLEHVDNAPLVPDDLP
jgi:hypothetical protein